nr:uncharacterized protein LOC118086847 [Zootoca vivipara]
MHTSPMNQTVLREDIHPSLPSSLQGEAFCGDSHGGPLQKSEALITFASQKMIIVLRLLLLGSTVLEDSEIEAEGTWRLQDKVAVKQWTPCRLERGIDFDEDQISEISLEDGEDLPPSIPTTGSPDAADVPPESFSEDQLKARLTDVVTTMKSGKKMVRREALRDLSALLQKIQEYPSVVLPASSLGQLVAISCLCALDPDPECRQRAAEALCHLLPILRHKEETLA